MPAPLSGLAIRGHLPGVVDRVAAVRVSLRDSAIAVVDDMLGLAASCFPAARFNRIFLPRIGTPQQLCCFDPVTPEPVGGNRVDEALRHSALLVIVLIKEALARSPTWQTLGCGTDASRGPTGCLAPPSVSLLD